MEESKQKRSWWCRWGMHRHYRAQTVEVREPAGCSHGEACDRHRGGVVVYTHQCLDCGERYGIYDPYDYGY